MQFEIKPYSVPDMIDFNYEELKTELVQKTEMYKTVVYTDDQLKEAKADRALLNKTKTALNDERIRIQKIYMKPFDEFKAKVDDLIGTINSASAVIDKQIKEFEEKEKREKEKAIREIFERTGFQPCVKLERIWNTKWLNKSYSLKQIEQDLMEWKYKVSSDLLSLERLPEKEIATGYYKQSLDINDAIRRAQEHVQMEKMKAEAAEAAEQKRKEREAAEMERRKILEVQKAAEKPVPEQAQDETQEPKRSWISFEAYLSREEARELKMFFDSLGIAFRPIQ